MEIIVKYSGEYVDFLSEFEDIAVITAEDLGQGFAVVNIAPEMIDQLYTLPSVEDIEIPKDVFLNDYTAENSNCTNGFEFRIGSYSGKKVLVGIIDTGIDYTNPEFLTADGRTRIVYLWDQSQEGQPPKGFNSGAEYTRERINTALLSSSPFSVVPRTDYSGHGTAVAGIAAGNRIGAAYQAEIIAVKVGNANSEGVRTVQLMKGLRYVIDRARELKMPVAINISFGMNEGSHRGDSLFESYLTAVSSEWKTSIIIPTGNEGGAGHHYEGQLQNGETLDIGFFTAAAIQGFYLSIWKNYTDLISAELFLPDGKSTGVIYRYVTNSNVLINGLSVTSIYGQPSQRSVFQEIFYDIRPAGGMIPSALWTLRIRAENIVNGHLDIWLPTVEQVTAATYFVDSSEKLTMTIPSTAARIIRAAGYNAGTGAFAAFSGRGAEFPEYIYPDVAAPAVNVSAPSLGGGIDSFTGTSFAAPLVTGISAQLMEWGIVCGNSPFMYGEKLKAELRLIAERSSDGKYPNIIYGYGTL